MCGVGTSEHSAKATMIVKCDSREFQGTSVGCVVTATMLSCCTGFCLYVMLRALNCSRLNFAGGRRCNLASKGIILSEVDEHRKTAHPFSRPFYNGKY